MDETDGAIIGFIAGLLVAIGGAIKDAPYEGFKDQTSWRSPLIGMVWGMYLAKKYKNIEKFPLFFAVIGLERATVEAYKLFRAVVKKNYKPAKFEYGEWGIKV